MVFPWLSLGGIVPRSGTIRCAFVKRSFARESDGSHRETFVTFLWVFDHRELQRSMRNCAVQTANVTARDCFTLLLLAGS